MDPFGIDISIKTSYIELSNSFGKITPYVRYEDHTSDYASIPNFSRYTGGINYRPIFEITLKAEYMHYKNSAQNLDGFAGTLIYSF
jgi:hypothetical protein